MTEVVIIKSAVDLLVSGTLAWWKAKRARQVCREAIVRELNFNLALLYEATDSESKCPNEDAVALLKQLAIDATGLVVRSGYPLSEIIPSEWQRPESAQRYGGYLQDCNTKADLLEKAFHRVVMLRLLAQEGKLGERRKLDYAVWLLREAVSQIRKERGQV